MAASALEATDPLDRLERAVARLDLLVRQAAASLSRVEPLVHTEVLAIIGALAIEEVAEAATRAENLVTWISGSMT